MSPPAHGHHYKAAALLMLLSAVLFGLMAVSIRLASQSLHTFEVAFFRNFFGLLATLPLFFRHGPDLVRTRHLPRYLLRCLVGVIGMMCGFWAIGHLPLAQAVALSYSSPIFVVIAAALFLGERVHVRRWTAVAVGFIGVLVITRPGSAEFNFAMALAIVSAFMTGLVSVQIKQLSALEPPDRIVFFTTLIWVPMSLLPALFVWRWPEGSTWLWVIASGVLGTGGHMLWTRALKLGDVSALTPISFTQLPVVALAGWLLFGEHVDLWTLVGTTIILAASAYIAHREAQLARQRATTEPLKSVEPAT
jgi:drug/metabolite transporter (DMT)-like permease